jgi:uncharacterized protein YbjT (DUF2867 family)
VRGARLRRVVVARDDAEDIAEVAASALTEDRHGGRTCQLTGPRAISFGAAADLIGRAVGRTVYVAKTAAAGHWD